MSLFADSYFPPPQGWDAFEGMIYDVFTYRLGNPHLKRYGRQGQAQHGIDIAGSHNGSFIAIQCKNHPGGKITTKEIDAEIAKAEGFQPAINLYIIATSASRDVEITQHIFKVSGERTHAGKFAVDIYFWEDVCHELVRNPRLLEIHFPELQTALAVKSDEEKATELKKRRALANKVLPFVAKVQMSWDERIQSDTSGYFFEEDKNHCFGAMLNLQDILKAAIATSVVQHNDGMTERLRGSLAQCRELMWVELEEPQASVSWRQYRRSGEGLISNVRRAFLDFIKEEEATEQRHVDEYLEALQDSIDDSPFSRFDW